MEANTLPSQGPVFDGHCDTLLAVLGRPEQPRRRLGERASTGHLDLPRMREGGVHAQVFACYVRPEWRQYQAAGEALRILDAFYGELEANAAEMALAATADEVEAAYRRGQTAALLAIEGGEALEESLGNLRMFHRLGVRLLTLTWNFRNALADGVGSLRADSGLTEFGVQVVREMNRLGMLVDIAHLAPRGVADVFALSEQPVVDSHANARALADHPRNLTDAQLEALARSGGVIGVSYVPRFIADNPAEASVARLVDHIDHIVQVAGVDHVGLGSDWDGISGEFVVQGLPDVSATPAIVRELHGRGYSAEAMGKIMGGNWLRVWRQVVG
ncbi:MAG: membrane dipeptidase [Chloroflexi bacterium]|nr:membrane dipeptidase [Chloroflexota bacterium]